MMKPLISDKMRRVLADPAARHRLSEALDVLDKTPASEISGALGEDPIGSLSNLVAIWRDLARVRGPQSDAQEIAKELTRVRDRCTRDVFGVTEILILASDVSGATWDLFGVTETLILNGCVLCFDESQVIV